MTPMPPSPAASSPAGAPDSLTTVRGAGNPSSAQITSGAVTDPTAYRSTFPTAVRSSSLPGQHLRALRPALTADSKVVASGTFTAPALTVAGVTYQVSGSPQAGDQFAVNANTHQNQSVLETISQLRAALDAGHRCCGEHALKNSIASAVANLASAREQVDITRGSIGARGNSLEIQRQENTSLTWPTRPPRTPSATPTWPRRRSCWHCSRPCCRLRSWLLADFQAEPVQQDVS
jgi:flagellar hook-associated protein 3 FlgL